ncbi:hypothetical protein L218DRAFT_948467 [Marasmius fiardii PR-910]|nr:hypothetical protein L218DRAFT_948467 [Marasmius fiardii PR-910]
MTSIKPRQIGIPTPSRSSGGGSGIPTPGGAGTRSRSSSQAGSLLPTSSSAALEEEYMNLAFKNAVKANDPASHRVTSISSSNSTNGGIGRSQSQGTGLNQSLGGRAKTPTSARPASRQSDVGLGATRSVSRAGWVPEVGDAVRIESLGFEGILKYVGDIEGKPGLWAGVELSGGFAGKGKNDGSVAGKQYFTCPPKCGVFVATTKLSPPTVSHPAARPSSVASSRGGRVTPSFTTSTAGRITPSSFSMSRGPSGRMSYGSGRTTPSTSGRITPSTSTSGVGGSPETPAVRAARLRAMKKGGSNSTSTTTTTRTGIGGLNKSTSAGVTPIAKSKSMNTANQAPVPVPGVPTPGSRASKYAGMTAKQLSLNKSLSSPSSKSPVTTSITSPKSTLSPLTASNTNIPSGVSPTRIRTISNVNTNNSGSSLPGPGSPFSTPKPRLGGTFAAPSLGIGSPASGNTPKPRIPSGLAMPPPPVPLPRLGGTSPMRSVSATSTASTASLDSPSASPTRRARITEAGVLSSDELGARGKALQDRIAELSGKVTPSPSPLPSEGSSGGSPPQSQPPPPTSPTRRRTIINGRERSRSRAGTVNTPASPRRPPSRSAGHSSRPSSVASARPGSVTGFARSGRASVDVEQMQSRIEALEYENTRLRGKVDDLESLGSSSTVVEDISVAVEEEKKKVSELSEKVEGLESDKTKMATDLRRLEERRAELEAAYDRAEADKIKFISEQGELQSEKTRLEELVATLQSDAARYEEEKALLEKEKVEAEQRVQEVETARMEVEGKLKKATVEFEEERRDLGERIDELRQAGQETIALYEEKLRQSDLQKYELEDRIVELETQAGSALSKSTNSAKINGKADGDFGIHRRSSSTASSHTAVSRDGVKPTSEEGPSVAQSTSQIEAETLQLQLSHLQNKIASLEDLLDDTRSTHEGEVSAFSARLEKVKEREEGFRKEVGELKRQLGDAQREKERAVREGERRVMEVEEALRESTANLEEMRAEVEGLRGDLANMNGLAASTSSVTGELQNKLTDAQIRAEQEKEGFLDEIQRLTEKVADWEERCEKLKRLTEDQTAEIEGMRKKANRDVAINGTTLQSPSTPSKQEKYDKHELNTAKEENKGLKLIIQEMQKEMLAETQKNKVLESENQLLMSEMEQLRQLADCLRPYLVSLHSSIVTLWSAAAPYRIPRLPNIPHISKIVTHHRLDVHALATFFPTLTLPAIRLPDIRLAHFHSLITRILSVINQLCVPLRFDLPDLRRHLPALSTLPIAYFAFGTTSSTIPLLLHAPPLPVLDLMMVPRLCQLHAYAHETHLVLPLPLHRDRLVPLPRRSTPVSERAVGMSRSGPSDVEGLKKSLKEQRLRADVEIEQLRKKLTDVEMKNARTTHDLNKEISELEALVEAKIYREDELEQEVEHLKEKLAKHDRKKAAKSSTDPDAIDQSKQGSRHVSQTSSSSTSTLHTPIASQSSQDVAIVCEICEKPGHDIFNCDLLKENGPLSAKSITSAAHRAINGDRDTEEELDLWCEDCEGHGHSAENCPNSEDVF